MGRVLRTRALPCTFPFLFLAIVILELSTSLLVVLLKDLSHAYTACPFPLTFLGSLTIQSCIICLQYCGILIINFVYYCTKSALQTIVFCIVSGLQHVFVFYCFISFLFFFFGLRVCHKIILQDTLHFLWVETYTHFLCHDKCDILIFSVTAYCRCYYCYFNSLILN